MQTSAFFSLYILGLALLSLLEIESGFEIVTQLAGINYLYQLHICNIWLHALDSRYFYSKQQNCHGSPRRELTSIV
jgi:hypothetical protein